MMQAKQFAECVGVLLMNHLFLSVYLYSFVPRWRLAFVKAYP